MVIALVRIWYWGEDEKDAFLVLFLLKTNFLIGFCVERNSYILVWWAATSHVSVATTSLRTKWKVGKFDCWQEKQWRRDDVIGVRQPWKCRRGNNPHNHRIQQTWTPFFNQRRRSLTKKEQLLWKRRAQFQDATTSSSTFPYIRKANFSFAEKAFLLNTVQIHIIK